jgi:hypothetical protein
MWPRRLCTRAAWVFGHAVARSLRSGSLKDTHVPGWTDAGVSAEPEQAPAPDEKP